MTTAEDMLNEHVRDERLLCGARSVPYQDIHVFSGRLASVSYTCTLELGHEPELHEDRRHCYRVHKFAVAVSQEVEDWSTCVKCRDLWPCDTVKLAMVMNGEAGDVGQPDTDQVAGTGEGA